MIQCETCAEIVDATDPDGDCSRCAEWPDDARRMVRVLREMYEQAVEVVL